MVFRTVFQTVFRARKTLVSASEKERQEPVIYTPLTRKAMEIAYNADLEHNADETRVEGNPSVTEEQRLRRREKYRKAKEILLERR